MGAKRDFVKEVIDEVIEEEKMKVPTLREPYIRKCISFNSSNDIVTSSTLFNVDMFSKSIVFVGYTWGKGYDNSGVRVLCFEEAENGSFLVTDNISLDNAWSLKFVICIDHWYNHYLCRVGIIRGEEEIEEDCDYDNVKDAIKKLMGKASEIV